MRLERNWQGIRSMCAHACYSDYRIKGHMPRPRQQTSSNAVFGKLFRKSRTLVSE